MHISSKARRAINNIDTFCARSDYPQHKKISYETTKTSLRYFRGELESLINREPRKENFKGSHYISCDDLNNPGCKCQNDNRRIEEICSDVQRLLRGM